MSRLVRHGRAFIGALVPLVVLGCRSVATSPPSVDPATAAARVALANEQSLDPSAIPVRTIGIPPLAVRAADTALAPLGYGLADLLISDLVHSHEIIVLDRLRMDALLRELELTRSGAVDSATAPRVGRLIGARRLVVGALNDRGNGELGIDTRLANSVDGSITAAVSARTPLASILDAEKALVYRLLEELHVTLTPAERAAIDERPTASVAGFLAYSRGVRDETLGNYASASVNFRSAIRLDPGFDLARSRLTRVQSRLTASTGSAGKSGATGRAGSAINPSPIASLEGGAGAAQELGSEQDRGAGSGQRASSVTTVIVNVNQLP